MAKRSTRRSSRRAVAPPGEGHRRLWRHAGVWLATLSTVVGVATGMFTLRDQVFPREAGTAAAVSVPAYQQEVGGICDEVNANDRARARGDKAVKRELQRAKTVIAQRNALLDGVRRTAARSGHTLASLAALVAPPSLEATQTGTQAAWQRNLARLRDYSLRLDQAARRTRVAAAIDHLSTLRPALARDGDRVRAGLQRLGGPNCDLEPPVVTRTYTLPPLQVDKPDKAEEPEAPTGNTPPPSATPESVVPQPPVDNGDAPPPTGGGNTPPPSEGGGSGGANTPPVTGGGEDGGGGD
jgi:hypothetical protein